jgi:Kef-type K+ transport system membrane component KefB
VVLLTVWLTRRLAGEDPASTGAALTLGFALIAAALAGTLFERVKLPRITGYLVFGMICGPYMANLVDRAMARELQFVNGLAIVLIAFMAGLELNLRRLAPRLAAMTKLGAVILLVSYVGLFATLWTAWTWLPISPEATGMTRTVQALLLTVVVVSFSPTVTIAVIADSRARGPLTEIVISIVVLADLALILGFTAAMHAARWTFGGDAPGDVPMVIGVAWEVLGSLAFGALVGTALGFYLRWVGRELTVVLLSVCAALTLGGSAWHFEGLLAALAAGLVVENVARSGDTLRDAVERGSLPVLVVFFAAAGMSLYLDALAAVGVAALGIALARLVFVRASTWAGSRIAGLPSGTGDLAWMGLISQAGVTLGLAIIIASEFPGWGVAVQTLVVAMIAIHELVGPILFKAALVRAGEVGQMDREAGADERSGLVSFVNQPSAGG